MAYLIKGIHSNFLKSLEGSKAMRTLSVDLIQGEIIRGNTFYINLAFGEYEALGDNGPQIASGDTLYLKVSFPSDKSFLFLDRKILTTSTESHFRIYTTFSGGTEGDSYDPLKLRSDGSEESGTTITRLTDLTSIDYTSRTINVPLFGTEGRFQSDQGDSEFDSSLRILPAGGEILIALTNDGDTAMSAYLDFRWIEIDLEDV